MKGAERDRIGATRGKLTLVGVLAVVLVYVLASNFRNSADDLAVASARPAGARAMRTGAKSRGAKPAAAAESPFGDFAADADWPQAPLDRVVSFDPLATPAWRAGDAHAATKSGAPGAPSLAQLQQAQNAIIFVAGDERVARIGAQDYHVGDIVGGFQITEISSQGIVLSESTGNAAEPK